MLELPPGPSYYLQIVLFLLLAAALRALIWTPTQKVLAQRAARTTGAQSEAARMREEATALEHQLEETLEQARLSGGDAGEQVRRDAEAEERRILEAAHSEAVHILDEMRARVGRESEEARVALRTQADSLARLAAERILGRTVSA